MGVPFGLAVLGSMAVVALVGAGVERGFLRPLYGLDPSYQLLLTFGLVLFLDDLAKLVWGGVFRIPPIPGWLQGSVTLFGRPYPFYNLFLIAVGLSVGVGLWWLFDRTWWGRAVRATASDREMAAALGIRTPTVFSSVFMLGSALAALGGALSTPVRPVAPGIGAAMIVQAFIITVIGGLGNLRGAFAGSLLVGVLSSYGTLWFPEFELFFIFAIMAAVLLVRPQGLFAR